MFSVIFSRCLIQLLHLASVQLNKIQESIEFINAKPKPLAIYAFTKDETFKRKIVSETSSGSVIFNDTLVQVLLSSNLIFLFIKKIIMQRNLVINTFSVCAVFMWYITIWRCWAEWFWKVPWEVLFWHFQPWKSSDAQKAVPWNWTKVPSLESVQARVSETRIQAQLLWTITAHVGFQTRLKKIQLDQYNLNFLMLWTSTSCCNKRTSVSLVFLLVIECFYFQRLRFWKWTRSLK